MPRKPETSAQRQARVERYNAWAMRQYANMELSGNILRSNPAFRAIIEYDTAMLDEEDPAVIAELKTRFTQQDREDYMEALKSPTKQLIVRDEGKAALQLIARFPRDLASPDAALQFVQLARQYDLDPFLGEIIPYQGRPYVTQLGWEGKVDSLCFGQMVEYNARLATPEEYEARHVPKEDVLAFGWCVRLLPNGRERRMEGWGIVSKDEYTGAKMQPEKRGYTPVEKDAPSMAEKRARFKALRLNFADVFKRVGLPVEPMLDRDSIDGEAVEVSGELWDAETGEVRAELHAGLEEISQEMHAATAEPAPKAPTPGPSTTTLVETWKILKDFVGEGKATAAYQTYIEQHSELEPPLDEAQQLEVTKILLKAAQAAAGRKARLDAAEKPA